MLCLVEGAFQRCGLQFAQSLATARVEGLEGQIAQFVEVAEREQTLAHLDRHIPAAAVADFDAPEIGVTKRKVAAQVAYTAAQRAVRVAGQITCRGACGTLRLVFRRPVREVLQRFVYFALCHVLLPSSHAKWLPHISSSVCCA